MGTFHTFWNAGDKTVRFIEIITPGNFEYYFAELAPCLIKGQAPQMDKVRETAQKYGLVVDLNATAEIIEKYGLTQLP